MIAAPCLRSWVTTTLCIHYKSRISKISETKFLNFEKIVISLTKNFINFAISIGVYDYSALGDYIKRTHYINIGTFWLGTFWPTGTFCFEKGTFWLGTFWVWDVLTVGRFDNGTFWLDTAGSPSKTMWYRPRFTSAASGILIHPTAWQQYANVTGIADRETYRQRFRSIGRTAFGRPFLKRFALSYRTVVCLTVGLVLSCLFVSDVGVLWPNGWIDQCHLVRR